LSGDAGRRLIIFPTERIVEGRREIPVIWSVDKKNVSARNNISRVIVTIVGSQGLSKENLGTVL
jgi:hypothetical protein